MIKYVGKCLLINEGKEKVLVIGDIHLGSRAGIGGIDIAGEMEKEMLSEFGEVFEKVKELSPKGFDGWVEDDNRNRGGKNEREIVSDNKRGKREEYNLRNRGSKSEAGDSDNKVVDKIILLGDLKHDFSSLTEEERYGLVNLFDYLEKKCREIIVIRGNHDNYLLNILAKRGLGIRDYYLWKEFCFLHGDREFPLIWSMEIRYWIMGHLHPVVTLREGAKAERYKCFLTGKFKGKEVIILPSFAEIGEGIDVREFDNGESNLAWKFSLREFEVKIVGEKDKVLDFGKLKKL